MSQPYISRNREEQYAAPPSYGYGQGVGLVPKVTSVVENTQAQKKPFLINYYPSGNTNNPQRVIAQVETVTREVVENPVTMIEPMRETRSHHGDSQLRRDDEFMNKIREETMKASTGINDQPKVLSTNNLVDQVIRDEVVSRNIQPSTMIDGWTESSDLADPSHPRKMAELVSRVSNWRGVNGGSDRTSRPIISDGYNPAGYNNPTGGYGYNNQGYDQSPTLGYNGSRNNNNKITYVTPNYDQNIGYRGDPNRISSNNMINGSYVRSDEMGYNGNRVRPTEDGYTRRNEMMMNPQTPRGTTYGYNEPRILGYDGTNNSVMSNQLGYGYGVNNNNGKVERTTAEYDQVYGNGYNSGLPRSSYAGRPGTMSSTVISSVEAVNKYKGTFVPRMQ